MHSTAKTKKSKVDLFRLLASLIAIASLISCSPGQSWAAQESSTPPRTRSLPANNAEDKSRGNSFTAPSTMTPEHEALVEQARADLAQNLGIKTSQIRVVATQAVVWPNTGLGCPQPGMLYAQTATDGYRIILEAGQRYEYHTDQKQSIVLCSGGTNARDSGKEETMPDTPTISPPQDPYLKDMVILAQKDLAGRLAMETDQIELLAVQEVTWSDASLGCPDPNMRYAQVPQDGLLIRLRARGQRYEYHSSSKRGPFLCEQADAAQKSKRPPPIDLVPPGSSEND